MIKENSWALNQPSTVTYSYKTIFFSFPVNLKMSLRVLESIWTYLKHSEWPGSDCCLLNKPPQMYFIVQIMRYLSSVVTSLLHAAPIVMKLGFGPGVEPSAWFIFSHVLIVALCVKLLMLRRIKRIICVVHFNHCSVLCFYNLTV